MIFVFEVFKNLRLCILSMRCFSSIIVFLQILMSALLAPRVMVGHVLIRREPLPVIVLVPGLRDQLAPIVSSALAYDRFGVNNIIRNQIIIIIIRIHNVTCACI